MTVHLVHGDCRLMLEGLQAESVDCVVTSPPYYGLRDYGVEGQIGLEKTPGEFVDRLVEIFREVRRVLKRDGTLWLNLGDTYASGKGSCFNPGGNTSSFNTHTKAANVHPLDRGNKSTLAAVGLKPKDLIGIPWMVAFALRADGWWLRQEIIWAKPNPMPESVTDRCTKSHEHIFMLTKSQNYYFDAAAIAEDAVKTGTPAHLTPGAGSYQNVRHSPRQSVKRGGFNGKTNAMPGREAFRAITEKRNKRDVWTVPLTPFDEAHFATFPPDLIEPCILAGCRPAGTVLDPFGGAGTTGLVADRLGRNAILIELNPAYSDMAKRRIQDDAGMFAKVEG